MRLVIKGGMQKMNVSAISDIGKVRDLNEDNYCILEKGYELFIVADGMGGHNAGERDLISGLQDVKKIPIIAVINKRPEGPCVNTLVDLDEVERAIKHFLL